MDVPSSGGRLESFAEAAGLSGPFSSLTGVAVPLLPVKIVILAQTQPKARLDEYGVHGPRRCHYFLTQGDIGYSYH